MGADLRACNISVQYGALRAVADVSVTFRSGRVTAVIGPNGAGKSSLFAACVNWTPHHGRIEVDGTDVTSTGPELLARRGVVRTFQANLAFPELTVRENLAAVAELHDRWSAGRRPWSRRRGRSSHGIDELLHRAAVPDSAVDRYPAELPFSVQRHLSLAIALALEPDVLLLDEPAAGLGENELHELGRVIGTLARDDIAVGLIEHHMSLVMAHADEVVVLDDGAEIFRGTPAEVQASAEVQRAYLGVA